MVPLQVRDHSLKALPSQGPTKFDPKTMHKVDKEELAFLIDMSEQTASEIAFRKGVKRIPIVGILGVPYKSDALRKAGRKLVMIRTILDSPHIFLEEKERKKLEKIYKRLDQQVYHATRECTVKFGIKKRDDDKGSDFSISYNELIRDSARYVNLESTHFKYRYPIVYYALSGKNK